MESAILAAFKRYTPDDLDDKTLPELCRLFVKAQRVLTQHPTSVVAWADPSAVQQENDPALAGEFQ